MANKLEHQVNISLVNVFKQVYLTGKAKKKGLKARKI